MKRLIYLLLIAVFLGTKILVVDVGIKLSLYRIIFLLTGYLFVLMIINNDQQLRFYPSKFSNMYTVFYVIWLLHSLISISWSRNLAGWAKANIFIGIGVFSIIFIQLFIKEKKDLLNVFRSIALGTSIHVILGLYELVTGKYFWAGKEFLVKYKPASRNFFTRIPISIYANENDYATVLLMGSFVILFLAREAKSLYLKIGYTMLWICCFGLIYQTDSRANVFAFFVGLAAMVAAYFSRIITRKGIILTLGLFGTLGVGALIISSSLRVNIIKLLTLLAGTEPYSGSSNETRINLIKNGFYFLRNSLGFGVGAGNIEHYMKTTAIFQTGGISNMHNWWMEILTGYGIIIFVMYVLVYVSMMYKAYQYYQHNADPFVRKASLSILGYLVAYILSSISSATNVINEWQWVIFGVIIAFFSYCESNGKKKRVEKLKKQLFNRKKEIEMF